jgi:hypothetical protein
VIILLALIALQQFGYPITAYGTAALVAYELLYDSISCFAAVRVAIILADDGLIFS